MRTVMDVSCGCCWSNCGGSVPVRLPYESALHTQRQQAQLETCEAGRAVGGGSGAESRAAGGGGTHRSVRDGKPPSTHASGMEPATPIADSVSLVSLGNPAAHSGGKCTGAACPP